MSQSRNRSDLLVLGVLLVIGSVAALFLTTWYSEKSSIACDGRVKGAATPEAAASTFLRAVASDDERLACSVLAGEQDPDEVRTVMDTVRRQLSDASMTPAGPHELSVGEQMGSAIPVSVSQGDNEVELFVLVVSYPTFQTFYRVLPPG